MYVPFVVVAGAGPAWALELWACAESPPAKASTVRATNEATKLTRKRITTSLQDHAEGVQRRRRVIPAHIAQTSWSRQGNARSSWFRRLKQLLGKPKRGAGSIGLRGYATQSGGAGR